MRYLVDTQIFIWTWISPEKLSIPTRQILQNNEIFVSQVSLVEIAIKQKIGKLPEFPLTITLLAERIEQDNFNLLPITTNHIGAYDSIPLLENHRDPFDRLLLAIALSENMPIISSDANFAYYRSYIQFIEN
jgi:PIN domain nuclease of toxin-antitoxin system